MVPSPTPKVAVCNDFKRSPPQKVTPSNSKPRDFATISQGRRLETSAGGEKFSDENKDKIRQNAEGSKGNCKYLLSYEIPVLCAAETALLRVICSTLGVEYIESKYYRNLFIFFWCRLVGEKFKAISIFFILVPICSLALSLSMIFFR